VLYGGKLGTNLLKLGYVDEEALAYFLSDKLEVPYAHPKKLSEIERGVLDAIPREVVEKYRILPFGFRGKHLRVVMADPLDLDAVNEVSFVTGYVIEPMVAPESSLMDALEKHYGISRDRGETSNSMGGSKPGTREPAAGPENTSPSEPQNRPVADNPQELIWKKLTKLKEKRKRELLGENDPGAEAHPEVLPEGVVEGLKTAPDRDAVAGVLLDFIKERFGSGALLISKGERALGWKGVGPDIDDELVRKIRIPLEVPTTLNDAAVEGLAVIPGPGRHPMDNMLRKLLRVKSGMEILLTSIYYQKVVICYLVAVAPAGSATEEVISELMELSRLAGEAFARLIIERRRREKSG